MTATDGIKVVVPDPLVTIFGDQSLPPVVSFIDGFVGEFEGFKYVVAEISDPEAPPMTNDNVFVTWTPSVDVDATKLAVYDFGLVEDLGHTYLVVLFTQVDGFAGSTPLTVTITDEYGVAGSDTTEMIF